MAHPNAERLQAGYDAVESGDWKTVGDMFADDVVFHVAGANRFSGDYQGRGAVMDLFERRNREAGGRVEIDVHSIVADDEHAVALLTMRGERDGKNLEWRNASIYHMRDGRIVEAWGFNEDQRAVDDFWS